MAITRGITSIHGRKLALHGYGYVLAQDQDVATASTSANINSSTASNLPAGGVSLESATAATTYVLDAPIPGVRKEFWLTSTSTLNKHVTLASGSFRSSTASGKGGITFKGQGQGFTAIGISTAVYQIIEHKSTAALTTG